MPVAQFVWFINKEGYDSVDIPIMYYHIDYTINRNTNDEKHFYWDSKDEKQEDESTDMRQCLIDFCYCQKAVAVYRNCEAALRFLDFNFADITEKSSLLSWKYMNTVGI